jgi:cell division protein ZapA (FtsZ GTPase activity inhibitor)
MKVTIARATVQVPVVDDEETTLALVERVNDRIAEMEAHAARIDSTAFALQAAFAFAAELHRTQRDHTAADRELTLALERIIASLKEIVDKAPKKA